MITTDKKYQTRNGCAVRIYSVGNGGIYPVHGAIEFSAGRLLQSWSADGRIEIFAESSGDLVEVVKENKTLVRWLNLYSNGFHPTKEEADRYRQQDCIACIRVGFKEGEGL